MYNLFVDNKNPKTTSHKPDFRRKDKTRRPFYLCDKGEKKQQQQQQQQQNSKIKNFTAKTQFLKLKAPSNNVKLQSDNTLTTQYYFC